MWILCQSWGISFVIDLLFCFWCSTDPPLRPSHPLPPSIALITLRIINYWPEALFGHHLHLPPPPLPIDPITHFLPPLLPFLSLPFLSSFVFPFSSHHLSPKIFLIFPLIFLLSYFLSPIHLFIDFHKITKESLHFICQFLFTF